MTRARARVLLLPLVLALIPTLACSPRHIPASSSDSTPVPALANRGITCPDVRKMAHKVAVQRGDLADEQGAVAIMGC